MKVNTAQEWAENEITQRGEKILSYEITRAMPWSQVSKFKTANGNIYLKQMAPHFALEPLVISLLLKELNAPVPQIIAHHSILRCFLMNDAGEVLRDKLKSAYQTDLVASILKIYAQIQLAAIHKKGKFLSLGVKDCRLATLPLLYLKLLEEKESLYQDGLTAHELNELKNHYPQFEQDRSQLARYGIPESLDQGDFHDNNILLKEGKITINDWGDTTLTHPFFSLGSWLDSAYRHHDLDKTDPRYAQLTKAYLECWKDFHPLETLHEAFTLSEKIRPFIFSLNFIRVTKCEGMENFGQFKGYIAKALREMLEP